MPHRDNESTAARAARDGEAPALAALWEACGLTRPWNDPARDFAFALAGPASEVLVIEREGRIAASVMVGHDGHRGAVYYVAVDPALRGQGLGRAIMAAAEHWLRERGVWKLNLMVRTGNEGATGFYAALGYGTDAVSVMSKRLTPAPHAVAD
ncbi:MAG: GNAT family acetyltransferase [Parvibaculum sp.]|uniref:GNAT family acetyltransferase n=1 Tax=Parvibaculum sp. TaxID=2024848 RepID=UPI00272000DB|nr:GNAT family acetyltransferase [Parvibaculum sp.]MDO8838668.1 GNAT family acetyltransferase [Parvibaculum sp.]